MAAGADRVPPGPPAPAPAPQAGAAEPVVPALGPKAGAAEPVAPTLSPRAGTAGPATPAPAAVLLAAGAGRRMGHVPKSLLLRGGEALLARQIRLLTAAGAQHIAVVLGHHAERLEPALQAARRDFAGLTWAVNPAPDAGPGGSLR